jgi:hypothetical protein
MENLSTEELEIKINNLNNTVVTLKVAFYEVKCEKAKKILQSQIDTYNNLLRQMLSALIDKSIFR